MNDFFPPQHDLDSLLLYCKKLCYGDHDDLFQDTIVKFLENRHRMVEYRYQFLMVIARNLFIDGYRKRKVRPSVTHEFPEVGYLDHEIESFDFDRLIMGAIEGIDTDNHRNVLKLWMGGKTYEEIRESMGMTHGAVASALRRGRCKVMKAITEAEK